MRAVITASLLALLVAATTDAARAQCTVYDGEVVGGWTVGHPSDTATTGIWEHGDPVATPAQPEDDHTPGGINCWFTGQQPPGGTLGTNDVDGGGTSLISPNYDLSMAGADATVSYWRWYHNSPPNGADPNNDIFRVFISDDGGATWVEAETVGPAGPNTEGGWIYHSFKVTDFVSLTSTVALRFRAADENAGSIVEAAIDDVTIDCGAIGTGYCGTAVPNSSGLAAEITAAGSCLVADNDLTLTASNMPANSFGFFLNSQMQGFTPNSGGSMGTLCLGGAVGRYDLVGQIMNSGAGGTISVAVDLGQTPTPTGFVQIAAGETWNFQAWFRDAVGGSTTSNLTQGVSVTFR